MQKIKPDMFHKAFCKTGIDPEGLTRVTFKWNHPAGITKEHFQCHMRGRFVNRQNFNEGSFRTEKITQHAPNGKSIGYRGQEELISRYMVETKIMVTIIIIETTEVKVEINYAGNNNRFAHSRFCNVNDRRYVSKGQYEKEMTQM